MTIAYAAARTSAAVASGSRRTFNATTSRATSRRASFHAATTSNAVPRTPTSHSCAIAALWSASPTTSAASAKRPNVSVDNGHQRQAEVHDPNPPREERLEAAPGKEADIGRPGLADRTVRRVGEPLRKPMDGREQGVHLDRK